MKTLEARVSGKYARSDVETLHIGGVWWEADARCLHSKNLRLLLWMDVDNFL